MMLEPLGCRVWSMNAKELSHRKDIPLRRNDTECESCMCEECKSHTCRQKLFMEEVKNVRLNALYDEFKAMKKEGLI